MSYSIDIASNKFFACQLCLAIVVDYNDVYSRFFFAAQKVVLLCLPTSKSILSVLVRSLHLSLEGTFLFSSKCSVLTKLCLSKLILIRLVVLSPFSVFSSMDDHFLKIIHDTHQSKNKYSGPRKSKTKQLKIMCKLEYFIPYML